MKKNILNIIKVLIPIIIIFTVMIVAVKAFTSEDENNELKEKTSQELLHLENKLISIANKVNNISFGHYIITESKIEDNLVASTSSNEESKNSKNGSNTGENSQESSSVESGEKNKQHTQNEGKIKYELKQESVLTANTKQIDWDYIKISSELLYSNWAQTVLDLHSLNIDNEDILSFGSTLDNLIIATKNENKIEVLKQISNLFSYLPKYEQKYSRDTKHINIEYTKYYVLNSYYLVEESKWAQMKESIDSAKNYFGNVINNIDTDEKAQSKISKIYVLLNELDNSINLKDKDLFYIKYKALMADLSNI